MYGVSYGNPSFGFTSLVNGNQSAKVAAPKKQQPTFPTNSQTQPVQAPRFGAQAPQAKGRLNLWA